MPEAECWWLRNDAKKTRDSNSTLMVEAMASCTAITYVNEKLVGDPLDVQMFEATGWILDENEQDNVSFSDQLVIAKVYPKAAQEEDAKE